MSENRLTTSQAQRLKRILSGETLSWTALPEWITRPLLDENVISISTNGIRKKIRVQNPELCDQLIRDLFTCGVPIDEWMELRSDNLTRQALVNKTGDSKTLKVNTLRGFLVNCIEPVEVIIDRQTISLTPHSGMSFFIYHPETLSIPEDVIVVGIENLENFNSLSELTNLFSRGKYIFVCRYPQNSALYEWLERIPNRYIHFGDFDLAGINIYQTEFYSRLGDRASMLIPDDIEDRIKHGNESLFNKQYNKFKSLNISDSRIKPLFDIIMRYHRCYEQEGYILV